MLYTNSAGVLQVTADYATKCATGVELASLDAARTAASGGKSAFISLMATGELKLRGNAIEMLAHRRPRTS